MASLALGVRFNPVSAGTADFVYSGAVTGYTNPTGLTDGKTYRYRAESADLSQWEWGSGTWTAGTSTLARTTVLLSSSGTSKISFTAAPQVSIVIFPADVLLFDDAMSLTGTQQGQARTNILAFGAVKKQVFTSSGTYTPSTGMLYAIIECQGPGGGGGGATGAASTSISGCGGNAGTYSRILVTAASVGSSQTVTVGTGGAAGAAGSNNGASGSGATSVGTLCTAPAGAGGPFGISSAYPTIPAASSTGTGDISIPGGRGNAVIAGAAGVPGGNGGSSFLGFGGVTQPVVSGAATGVAGTGYGSGGSSALINSSATTAAGGAGAPGIVIITEFTS